MGSGVGTGLAEDELVDGRLAEGGSVLLEEGLAKDFLAMAGLPEVDVKSITGNPSKAESHSSSSSSSSHPYTHAYSKQ